jgi:beta-glucosidase
MKPRTALIFFLLTLLCNYFSVGQTPSKKADIEKKIEKCLSNMSLEEKVGQMTQVTIDVISVGKKGNLAEPHQVDMAKLRNALVGHHVGSILNVANHCYTREHWYEIISAIQKVALEETSSKIPVLYGIDAIHGANYTEKSTLFPQQIAMAATWNPALVEKAGSITAYETRASAIPWTFSPVLDMGRHAAWPRIWETFGEDVYLAGIMGNAITRGYQGNDISDKYKVAACLKHYMGYSFPLSGKDRTPAWIPENYLREYFLPPFAEAIKAGARTVMINSGEINGTPVHADHHILTDILRTELGFDGIAVSDWEDIIKLVTVHHIAATQKEAVKIAVMAGIDMSMVPYDFSFYDYLLQLVKEGSVPEWRINEAVKRILRIKFELGLFENAYFPAADYPKFGSDEFRQASLETAREAITLLKNDKQVLPLKKQSKVLVTGFAANSMQCLNGGWSYSWQGELTNTYAAYKNTILEAIQQKIGKNNVLYAEGTQFDKPSNAQKALQLARSADYIVLCLGELSYTEASGNISDLYLPDAQVKFAHQLAATGKPVVLVLTEGRPRIISKFADEMKGIVMAYLPGNEGGNAIADILFGDVNPSGKLSLTYPRYPNDLTNYDRKYSEEVSDTSAPNTEYKPQFPFGFGLSYTTFRYSNLVIDKSSMGMDETLHISGDITNTGKLKGKEVAQLYISDLYASITPSVKRLRGFEKTEIEPGKTKTVTFSISASDLAFVNRDLKWITEPGEFEAEIGGLKKKFEIRN